MLVAMSKLLYDKTKSKNPHEKMAIKFVKAQTRLYIVMNISILAQGIVSCFIKSYVRKYYGISAAFYFVFMNLGIVRHILLEIVQY